MTQAARNEDLRRYISGGITRADEAEDSRRFTLSFSSETPYERYWGIEILDHSAEAVDLSRINEIGCMLYNHDRDRVIGKILRAWIEDGRGMAEVEFDDDADSEVILRKVRSGTLKGVSVGYRIDTIEEVSPGKVSVDGRFTGPCCIARRWWPFEISIVSVPADPTVGVGRQAEEAPPSNLSLYEAILKINLNRR